MINVVWLVLMIGPLIELDPFCVKKDNSSCKSKICKLNRSYRSLSEDHFNIAAERLCVLLQFRGLHHNYHHHGTIFSYLKYTCRKTLHQKFHETDLFDFISIFGVGMG